MKRDENGYIVVETIGCFVLFVFLMTSILSLINIVTLQARVHYALTQTAQTISMYSYALEALGLADPLMKIEERAGNAQQEVDTFKNNLNTLIDAVDEFSVEKGQAGLNGMGDQFNALREKGAKEIFQDFLNYGVSQAEGALFELALQPLMSRYLANGTATGNDYLNALNVVNESGNAVGTKALNFYSLETFDLSVTGNNNSQFMTKDGDIRIRVSYYIDYTFGALPLPFTKLHVTQEVTTKAWLGGEGDGYSK